MGTVLQAGSAMKAKVDVVGGWVGGMRSNVATASSVVQAVQSLTEQEPVLGWVSDKVKQSVFVECED